MTKLEQAARQACQTPLKDLLRSVPKDGRDCYEEDSTCHHFIPYGRLIHEALAEIERLEALAEQAEPSQLADASLEPVGWTAASNIVNDGYVHSFSVVSSEPANTTSEPYIPLYAAHVSIEAAVLAEREACAKVCEENGKEPDDHKSYEGYDEGYQDGSNNCAVAIRSRSSEH